MHPNTPSVHAQQGPTVERLGPPQPKQNLQTMKTTNIRHQRVYQLTPATLAPNPSLTSTSSAPCSYGWQRVHGERLAISANHKGEMVGLVIAECDAHHKAAMLLLMVSPQWRGQGLGTQLVAYPSQFLKQEAVDHMTVCY